MKQEQLFSSVNQAWGTPQTFYDELNAEFNFNFDPCCTTYDCKCPNGIYFDRGGNGLKDPWSGRVFMNNPYSENKLWIPRAWNQAQDCELVACLLPARTDTIIFHRYIWDKEKNKPRDGVELRFVPGRLTFGSDAYWKWLWDQPYKCDTETGEQLRDKSGKLIPNAMYQKFGKKNSAPFPSMVAVFRRTIGF